MSGTMQAPPLLQVMGISKSFPGVKALDNVSITVNGGEVVGLLGENGAGKSTLSKLICGVYVREEGAGEILLNGEAVHFHNPLDAKAQGVMMIFQELSLVLDLSVAENLYLGALPKKAGRVQWNKLYGDAAKVLEDIGCDIDPRVTVRNLPIAQQQMVEIGRAKALNARLIIFDEPTSSLTEKEIDILFENIRRLKQQGIGIIYISHKMGEIKQITDRIVVLRDGKNSGEFVTKDTGIAEVITSMIGRELKDYYHKSKAAPGKEVLRVESISDGKHFSDISLRVCEGEVVGLSGLIGAGRTEIVEAIYGLRKITEGAVFFEGSQVRIRAPVDALKLGICLVPEDRKREGLALRMSVQDNMQMAKLKAFSRFGFVDTSQSHRVYETYQKKLAIATTGPQQEVINLSGGNQQKVVLGKWLSVGPKLLILDEPTRGIDVGSKAQIHQIIASLAESGLAVLVISSEMPEIIGVSNRVYTITRGRLTGELTGDDITEHNLIHGITFVDGDVG